MAEQVNKCAIFVFSGTGNTARIAEKITESLRQRDVETEIFNIDKIKGNIPDISGYDLLGSRFMHLCRLRM